MKHIRHLFILFVLWVSIIQIVDSAENEYGIAKAWFNGKNATVEGVKLKMGESAEVKVEVISKINGNLALVLREPGVTKAFDSIGPIKMDESLVNYDVTDGWSKTYTWTITPNGAWKNGNAPLNIFVQFDKIVNGKIRGDKTIQFTIANPYILDEQYTGAPISTTGASEITDTGTGAKEAPFISVIFMICVLMVAWRFRGK